MAWFAELAGRAEHILNNLDEQTGAAIRNHTSIQTKKPISVKHEGVGTQQEPIWKKPKASPKSISKAPALPPRKLRTSQAKSIRSEPPKVSPAAYSARRSPDGRTSPESFKSKQWHTPESRRSGDRSNSPQQKSPERYKVVTREIPPYKMKSQYNFEHCQPTLVCDIAEKDKLKVNRKLSKRRYSFPGNLTDNDNFTYKIQNLDVENAMLKNELNVMNQEFSELLQRLRITEEEYQRSKQQVNDLTMLNDKISSENHELTAQVGQYKSQVEELSEKETKKDADRSQQLEKDFEFLSEHIKDLEEKLREHDIRRAQITTHNIKLESDLRHAHFAVQDLQEALDKSTGECHRLEKDWESYKVRVKNMLTAKDVEIKSLQAGMNLTEDTKILMEQIDTLKGEREELTQAISQMRREYGDMKACLSKLETRSSTSERLVTALRDALKEERAVKTQLEKQYLALSADIKTIQSESSKTIALLKAALNEKEAELCTLREATSATSATTSHDTSTLNVADCAQAKDEAHDKIEFLTQKLVQRQANVDKLLADNHMLRIQVEGLESKRRSESAGLKNHSVVNLDVDTAARPRSKTHKYGADSTMKTLSLRIGVFIRRHPIFRLLIIVYMIGLHVWVSTVLFTNAPDTFPKRAVK